jgi:hypothetical protein
VAVTILWRSLTFALFSVALTAPAARAQQPPSITLKRPTAALAEEFTLLRAVRELSDGRVLVTDAAENRLVVADLSTGSVTPIGRIGSGPGEYQRVSALVALAGDSTIFPDHQNRRWHLMAGAAIVATLPPETPVVRLSPGIILGADRNGHVLTQRSVQRQQFDPNAAPDSLYVVLADRATGRADSVARMLPQPALVRGSGRGRDGGPAMFEVFILPFTSGEQALLFADGWIAIARLDAYRVDWRSPEGRWVRGARLPFTPVKVDDREKRAHMERMARATGRPPRDPASLAEWPATIAPFEPGGLLASPDGRLIISRTPTAEAPGDRV